MTSDTIWYEQSASARVARALLSPPEMAYRSFVRLRNTLYDRHWLRSYQAPVPVISVGNLTVGGTGKTPVAAFVVSELTRRGARPAIVMRGYGADEIAVHQRLNPSAVVVADPDRVRGAREACQRGADVVVLDDGFQHRRLRRDADIVLIEAERWSHSLRCLPAGPLREPLAGLSRASIALVTQKSASPEVAAATVRAVRELGAVEVGIVRLRLGDFVEALDGRHATFAPAADCRAVIVSGIGNPDAFERQLAQVTRVSEAVRYGDHHTYSPQDVADLVARGARADVVVCTLKDAVKLGRLWPRNGPRLLYVSQRVELAAGAETVGRLLDRLLETGSAL